jgi:toxin ParE1/3/4
VFTVSRRAKADLDEIATYTLQKWGLEQALLYVDGLEACCRTLGMNLALGRACSDILPGLRRLEHAQHVVFYRIVDHGVFIIRVLHRKMLPGQHDFEASQPD